MNKIFGNKYKYKWLLVVYFLTHTTQKCKKNYKQVLSSPCNKGQKRLSQKGTTVYSEEPGSAEKVREPLISTIL